MSTIITNRQLIDPPPRQPRRYGLFDAATLLDLPDRVIAAGLQFYADDCGDFIEVHNPECGVNPLKNPTEGTELVGTDPYWLENRLRCGTVGRTAEDILRAARMRLDAMEQFHVERMLWSGDPAQLGILNLVNNVGTTIVTPIAPGAGAAISALENAYYQVNGYVGTIHVNTRAEGALQYAGMLQPRGGVLRTPIGSAVSLGAGYGIDGPAEVAPAAGFVWAFMTGYTTVWRSTEAQIPQPDPRRVMDRALNQWDVVAERVYAAAWSCPEVFAVQVPVAAPAVATTPAVPV
jgi:hypothetical protein